MVEKTVLVSEDSWHYGDDPVYFDWETGTTKIKQGYETEDKLCYFVWAKTLEDGYEETLTELQKRRLLHKARVKQMRELRKREMVQIFLDLYLLFPHWRNLDHKLLWSQWIESGA